MQIKKKAGLVGGIGVVAILTLQTIEHWTVIDAVMSKLRSFGSGGAFLADTLLSPIVPLVLAIAAIYLSLEGRKEKSNEKPSDPPVKTETNASAGNATASGNSINQFFGPLPLTPPVSPPTPQVEAEIPGHKKKAIITIYKPKKGWAIANSNGVWEFREDGKGSRVLTIGVYHDIALSPPGAYVYDLKAHLIFKERGKGSSNIEPVIIPAACWIGSHVNGLTLKPGETATFVLLARANKTWASVGNSNNEMQYSNADLNPFILEEQDYDVEIWLIWGSSDQFSTDLKLTITKEELAAMLPS